MRNFPRKENTNRFWPVVLVAFCLFLLPAFLQAQDNAGRQQSLDLVKKNSKAIGLEAAQLNNFAISKSFKDKTLDAEMVYLQETYQGIPVYNSIKSIAFKNGQAVSVAGNAFEVATRFKNQKSKSPSLKPFDAIVAAAKYLELKQPILRKALNSEANGQKFQFDKMDISHENITTELLWVKQDNNDVRLAWQVAIEPLKSSDMWLIQVDAITGKVIGKANLTVSCNWGDNHKELPGFDEAGALANEDFSPLAPPPPAVSSAGYRVLPYPVESPLYGSFALVNDPWLLAGAGNNSGTLGWHNDGTTEYNITRGNNVWAKEDRAGDNETTIGASTISTTAAPNYTFNDVFNPTTSATGAVNQKAAITNLFYWNNIVHDIAYQYGFDEASGNFQNDNQGRGGLGGDYVMADAQDGSGSNNANFNTPADGIFTGNPNPRMQMFLFSPSPNTALKINSPAAGFVQAYEVIVSANNKLNDVGPVTADVVLYDNTTNFGCAAAAAGAFAGKIVLIARGSSCNSQAKIANARNAGAVGVLLYQADASAAGTLTTTTDNSITIPAVLMTRANGLAIAAAVNAGTVNVTLSGSNLDGDFDNGVIVHEYGHGISNRLTGGAANSSCLQNKEQMGEGWSDYYGLMLTTNWATATTADGPNKRPLGNYVIGQDATGSGIRRYPYTTDMTINLWTYGMMATGTNNPNTGVPGEVHLTGEIWAATLWDMTWNIIGIDGINTNLYNAGGAGGNSVAMKLVTQGLKLQPCSPGFLDGRNAILKADTLLYGGRYSCAIWRAFARRGMGKNAVQGNSNSVLDQTEDLTLPNFNYDTTMTACVSFTWYGTALTTSGDYTHTVDMPGGCSRVVTLHLTILKAGITSVTASAATVCTNANVTLTAHGVSGPGAIVKWYTQTNGGGVFLGTGNPITVAGGPATYFALVTSTCGDSAEASLSIPQTLSATFTKNDVSCFGASNGSLTNIVVSGGAGPYTVSTSASGGFNFTTSLTGLKASTYRIFMIDDNGCMGFTNPIAITQPAKITNGFVSTDPSCFGAATGDITVQSTNGGTGGYTYALSAAGPFTGATTFSSLKAGSYRVYTKDGNACTVFSDPIVLTQPTQVVTTFTKTDAGCFGSATGSFNSINATGGLSPYTHSLSAAGPFLSVSSFTNLKASTYRIFTRDQFGCQVFTAPISIGQSPAIVISFSKTDVTCGNPNSGAITNISATGGSGSGYTFSLSPAGPFSAVTSFTGLKAGNYRVYAKDGSGCVVFTAIITIAPCITFARLSPSANETQTSGLSVYPNPSKGQFTLQLKGYKAQKLQLTLQSAGGQVLQTRRVEANTASQNVPFNLSKMPAGLYFIKVQSAEGVEMVKVVKE